MARKAFFAAFIIDEAGYAEPGPVDHHFVAADFAQSGFGEQPGISHIIVWDSAADLIADHCQRGPISAQTISAINPHPMRRSNTRQKPAPRMTGTMGIIARPRPQCHIDRSSPNRQRVIGHHHSVTSLFPTMRETLAFEYYEVRPCIERDRQVTSTATRTSSSDLPVTAAGREFRAFWSLYGVDRNTTSAIGDFVLKDAAHEVMNAILAILAAARNALQAARPTSGGRPTARPGIRLRPTGSRTRSASPRTISGSDLCGKRDVSLHHRPKPGPAGLFHFSSHLTKSSNKGINRMSRLNDPENFRGRVNYAAQVIAYGRRPTRAFDNCFENYDGRSC